MSSFSNRVLRSARLDASVYEEVEADPAAFGQAMSVVLMASLAAGIGSIGHEGIGGLFMGAVSALAGWFIWAGLTYFIGTRILPQPGTQADYGQLLRTLGFASAPGIIRIAGVIPGLMTIVFFVAAFWMLAATVIAVRQALDYDSTARAAAVCLIGWLVQLALTMIVFAVIGFPEAPPAP
jgi:hypothetical protein